MWPNNISDRHLAHCKPGWHHILGLELVWAYPPSRTKRNKETKSKVADEMEQTETKEISSNDNAENHEVDIAGEFGNFAGRADVLEAFYCYQEDDGSSDFGFGNSVKSLPSFPVELGLYREQNFQVDSQTNTSQLCRAEKIYLTRKTTTI